MKDLKFYYMEGCPFCNKVRKYMKDNDITVEMMDIHADHKNQEDLIKLGGIDQVPMLLIDGKPLYESDDIIQWFKENM
ncbi:glutathione S-transferase N-terminal domain-containing protein [Tissierella sp. Yu-01]|uniref:glutaredoxin family protein n=1 Tax=Tissierella sp. Yu-01 TaxID=3035694 RepID=UPI00240E913B|nr:glutathione S-transferase N-terminal domain-containing protein [Tissierella sp. Yu-01]WFA08414.1 glutathione S-transferase N-terminal domain-containing protein [Tissierella sp. Yu-01]